jgi:two-component sensor histidine kinase
MVLIHEKLYKSENMSDINFNEYIKDLVHEILNTYNNNSKFIASKINVENVLIDIDKAIPCGLIINEVVTNSIKYAFINKKKGTIFIDFFIDNNKKYNLILADDGIGLPKNINISELKSLGMQLLVSLTEQLQGEYEILSEPNKGTKIIVKF